MVDVLLLLNNADLSSDAQRTTTDVTTTAADFPWKTAQSLTLAPQNSLIDVKTEHVLRMNKNADMKTDVPIIPQRSAR
jgi:hypothetical protein